MRRISWVKAALKAFTAFPEPVQERVKYGLAIAAAGQMVDFAKPMKGLGAGVIELALPHRGDAFRVVYAVRIGSDLWVVHAFQKKSTHGIATPQHEIDVVRERLKRLKELDP